MKLQVTIGGVNIGRSPYSVMMEVFRLRKTKKKSLKQKKEAIVTPPIPKDKRTKEYKEWYKKYGKEKGKTETTFSTKKKESKVPRKPEKTN